MSLFAMSGSTLAFVVHDFKIVPEVIVLLVDPEILFVLNVVNDVIPVNRMNVIVFSLEFVRSSQLFWNCVDDVQADGLRGYIPILDISNLRVEPKLVPKRNLTACAEPRFDVNLL